MRRLVWFLFLLPFTVGATSLTVSWTNPAQNTDGSAIPATGPGSLVETRVEYGTCSGPGFGDPLGQEVVSSPSESATISDLAPGTYCVRAAAVNTYGEVSAYSNVASKTITTPVPNPPTLITVDVLAYRLDMKGNGELKLGKVVGSVPLGVGCGQMLVNRGKSAYHVVPSEMVEFSTPYGATVVAQCAASGVG